MKYVLDGLRLMGKLSFPTPQAREPHSLSVKVTEWSVGELVEGKTQMTYLFASAL